MNEGYRRELDYLGKKRNLRRQKHIDNVRIIIFSLILLMSGAALWWALR